MERYRDRKEAGRVLARKLGAYADRSDVIVLGLPRGGVAVAAEIARTINAPLDVFIVRKLGVPGYEELAMGAIATGGTEIIDPDIVEEFHLSQEEIGTVIRAEEEKMESYERIYRGIRPALDVRGRTVILVDDGIATGATMRAAIAALKRSDPAHIVVAAGVAPLSTYLRLAAEADEVVCPLTPREFRAVGLFYDSFPQLTDEEVCDFLAQANTKQLAARGSA